MEKNKQQGVAIITVLMVVTLAIGVSTYLIWSINNRIEVHDLQQRRLQSRLIAQTGIEWAGAILLDDLRTSGSIDSTNEIWAQPLPTLPIRINSDDPNSSVFISGNISDEMSKININNLAFTNNPAIQKYHLESIKKLLIILDIPLKYSYYLFDWIDANDELIEVNSAESVYYLKENPPYRAANQPLAEIANLSLVREMTPEILNRLKPYITFLPKATKININTASAEVLAATIPDISYSQALVIVENRKKKPFKKINDFLQLFSENVRKNIPIRQLSVSSSFFKINAQVVQNDNYLKAEALLERKSNRWPFIWWQKIL